MTEWISFKEREPKDRDRCWIYRLEGYVTEGTFYLNNGVFGKGFGNYEEFMKHTDVHSWMPYFTPEPPETAKREVPKDGLYYLCWIKNTGYLIIAWNKESKKYDVPPLGQLDESLYKNILRYMDEKGNWVEL